MSAFGGKADIRNRGLFKGECPTSSDIQDIFAEKPEEAQEYCGQVEERILDTAILGVDLYALERDALVELASRLEDDHDIKLPKTVGFFSTWGDHKDFVPVIRPVLRSLAVMGKLEDFEDIEAFPRRS